MGLESPWLPHNCLEQPRTWLTETLVGQVGQVTGFAGYLCLPWTPHPLEGARVDGHDVMQIAGTETNTETGRGVRGPTLPALPCLAVPGD